MSMQMQSGAPPFCLRQALRYAGVGGDDPEMKALMEDCLREAEGKFSYGVCSRAFPLKIQGNICDLAFSKVSSASLARHLTGCDAILLMAATIGTGLDRLIMKYGKIAPSRAVMMQALGTERIEALCDCFCEKTGAEMEKQGLFLTDRFSPGYGDLPLQLQRDIFRALQPEKQLGMILHDSLLISPSKSVTAIIGITKEKQNPFPVPCIRCRQENCIYRRNT